MHAQIRSNILGGLAATPVVATHLLSTAPSAIWDRKPDPARFSLREVVAHLADWETIWLERVQSVVKEPGALLAGKDPDQLAKAHHYEVLDLKVSLQQFQQGRAVLLKALEALKPEAWELTGKHSEYGPITVRQIAHYCLGHDAYHLRQIAEWIAWKDKPATAS